ncbi:hypothetical protein [Bacteriophage sp.]|nr:hypothetical protein [Bacteriophage sp.]UOF80105.1 hypothetical protein [Bacteriophage sp.]
MLRLLSIWWAKGEGEAEDTAIVECECGRRYTEDLWSLPDDLVVGGETERECMGYSSTFKDLVR